MCVHVITLFIYHLFLCDVILACRFFLLVLCLIWTKQIEVKRMCVGRLGLDFGNGFSRTKSSGQRGSCWDGRCKFCPSLECGIYQAEWRGVARGMGESG